MRGVSRTLFYMVFEHVDQKILEKKTSR